MTQIRQQQPAAQPGLPARPQAAAPAAAIAPARRDTAETGLDRLLAQLAPTYQQLQRAVEAGDTAGARQAMATLSPMLESARRLTEGTPHAASFARVDAAAASIAAELAKAPGTQEVFVGLPGRGGRMVEVDRQAPTRQGPLAGLGQVAERSGGVLDAVLKVVFFPLELAGKGLDPVREKVGGWLGGLKSLIDGSLGQVPVLGQVVRFATGFAASLGLMIDGALQGVTHPRELIKGLGAMAWTLVGLVPGPRMAWDMAVNGHSAGDSLKGAWGEGGAILKALFDGAIADAKAGNWAGALGRVTADVGAFFVTGGAANGGRAAGVGVKASRFARFLEVARANKVIGTGVRVLGGANELSAAIMRIGFKGNFAAWRGAGRLAAKAPGAQRVMGMIDRPAPKPRATAAAVTPASVMDRPKVAAAFAPESLQGEIRPARALSVEEAITAQRQVLKHLDGPAIYEAMADRVLDGLIDTSDGLTEALKGLKLDGKQVTSFEQAAEAWKALPPNAPERAQVGRRLAAHLQNGFGEGLKFPPAPIEFAALGDDLAGLETRGNVLIDPAVLNEDLGYMVNVLAEEQTHAYQRFLVENQDALPLPDRVKAEVAKYTDDLVHEAYLNPPPRSLREFAEGLDQLTESLKRKGDHTIETQYQEVRRQGVADMAPGTTERATLDAWWAATHAPSEQLSFLKYAHNSLAESPAAGFRTWLMDYAERLPQELTEHQGVRRPPSEVRSLLERAIQESEETLRTANRQADVTFRDWDQAYRNQRLEFTAKSVAADVEKWMRSE
ncbi:MAG: hypothetical protein ACLGIN_08845 [Candidatus Sericytochromatia bacterium]